jgi:hypothetical protein
MDRIGIINSISRHFECKSYLEIGLRNPEEYFNLIECENKDSVDPGFETDFNLAKYKYTSDSFFSLLGSGSLDRPSDYKWDIIFIDGLHTADQVEKDILNSINHLSEKGTIVLHDCNPPTEDHARAEYYNFNTPAGGIWNGTVWKSIYKFRSLRPDLNICVADCDWGVGIIRRGNQKLSEFNNPYYEYSIFSQNRKEHLNLISPSDVDKWIISPFYP